MSSGQRGTLRLNAEVCGSSCRRARELGIKALLWEEGCCGRRDAVVGGMLWWEGPFGRRDALVPL
jgi:hypothetical protein